MQLEMITTGEEVLSGQIVDTNAAWFSDLMMSHGVELQRRSTVGDRLDDLVALFLERSQHADVILVNGGLGPTSDDLSAEAAARALGLPLEEHDGWRRHLEEWFEKRGRAMPESNLKQCLLPRGAILVDNPVGSAPGFRLRLNRAWFFFTPGVPFEFQRMIENEFLPFLRAEFAVSPSSQVHKLLTLGYGESSLADLLNRLEPPPGITMGYRPSMPHVEVKLFARGEQAIAVLPQFKDLVRETLGSAVVSENAPGIAEEVHALLVDRAATLSLAESCTGGMLTSLLVEIPGSSSYLLEGLVTYSNSAKVRTLGVSQQTLDEHGAVSVPTAFEMARGARELLDSDYALSTTGIAGPEGGSEEKPVGTVCIGLAERGRCWVQWVRLSGRSRNLVKLMSSAIALDMLRRRLLGEDPIADYPFIPRVERREFPTAAGS